MGHQQLTIGEGDGDRDGVGGRPYLRDGVWPVCANQHVVGTAGAGPCPNFGQPMLHFLRFDVRAGWGTPFPAGAHVSFFQCVACCDAFIPPADRRLPAAFWDVRGPGPGQNPGSWSIAIDPPGAPLVRAATAEPFVAPRLVTFVDGDGAPRVGGVPADDAGYTCGCGSRMAFLAQLPANLPFVTQPGAPSQAGTYSKKKYKLFLGNTITVVACAAGCHPRAVVPHNH